ncbi:hypothetical protein Pan97_49670 [Bremerella volcania]|uniref:Uncharacterized protein n=1 Tax=Bremerella volcania TaxID=2527984 RepID=A0A518CF79_9BACT|nr:hypothetical protein [Bremerella volcania]QDU77888.1 hypothetical protein Pan97_49670 [Bremerella volcania]
MTISILAILLLGFLLACLVGVVILVIAVAGKHGGKVAAGLGAAVLCGMVLFCGGVMAFTVSATRVEPAMEAPVEVRSYGEAEYGDSYGGGEVEYGEGRSYGGGGAEYGESLQRTRVDAVSERKESIVPPHAQKVANPAPVEVEAPLPVSTDILTGSNFTTEEATASTGKTIGQFAGTIYQEFRNQLKSGKFDLDPSRIIPPGRPSWVEQEPHWGHDRTYYISVSSGPYDRGMDCRRALDLEISKAIDQFAIELTGSEDAPALIGDQLATIKETVTTESYQEELTPSFGVMHQWHSLLKFDPAVQEQIRQFWYAQQRISRVVYIGTGFLFLLGLMSIFYAGMSLTGKGSRVSPTLVSVGSVAALCGLIAAGVIFVRSFPML